ncbi:MAG: helix-turn-helix domain-containing protein [Kiritimatiellae bacterium]|nr:helix-turn-helix domain-containing protein [Kiritimatiellia bacterium]
MTAEEIRMELARRRMTRTELAREVGVSANYMQKILRGERDAEERRAQIGEYLAEKPRIKKEMRGIS